MVPSRNAHLFFVIVLLGLTPVVLGEELPVKLKRQGARVDIFIGGQPFTSYFFGSESPKPYLHPLRGAQGTIMMLTLFDPRMAMMRKELYYCDDESTPDEPCQFKGQIANSGYALSNIESVPKGNYTFNVYVFCLPGYKAGDEQAALDSVMHPLSVSAAALPASK